MAFFRRRKKFSQSVVLFASASIIAVLGLGYIFIYQPNQTEAAWYETSDTWNYRRQITIDHTKVSGSSALTNFPMLVSVTDANLKSTENGGGVASSTAGDIVFTSSDGTTKLDHEIEYYSSTTGELVAWVEIPSLSATANTVIYMYYGSDTTTYQPNPTGVWDADYEGVYHLKEDPTSTCSGTDEICDSTSNANHGDSNNMEAGDQITGKIGKALDFGGTDEGVSLPLLTTATTNVTTSIWVQSKDLNQNGTLITNGPGNASGWSIVQSEGANLCDSGSFIGVILGGRSCDATPTDAEVELNTWVYVVLTRGATTWTLYKNGVSVGTGTTNPNTPTVGTAIGSNPNNLSPFYIGTLDEARLSTVERSADWIATEYANQNSPETFSSFGVQTTEARENVVNNNGEISTSTAGIRIGARGTPSSAGWYAVGSTWTNRKKITINREKVSGSTGHTDFPMLFSRTDPDFKYTGSGGDIASSTAGDIVFTSSDGTTKLDHEIEYYSSTTGELVAWVRIPFLSSTTTQSIYIYYGSNTTAYQPNPTGVWDSSFEAVHHLEEDPGVAGANGITDSTSFGTHGTDENMDGNESVTGKIGKGINFEGNNNSILLANSSSIELGTANWTISAWVKPANSSASKTIVSKTASNGTWVSPGKNFALLGSGGSYIWQFDGNSQGNLNTTGRYNVTQWNYFATTFTDSNNSMTHYRDGIPEITGTVGLDADNAAHVLRIGIRNANVDMDGIMDEFRISQTVRSADWIKTEYNNQSLPEAFYAVSSSETPNRTDGSSTATSSAIKVRGGVKFR